MAPKGGCEGGTCEYLAGKVVPRSVGGLQVHDSGPMDPRPLHDHRCKSAEDQRCRRLGGPLPQIGDVEWASGATGGTMVGPASVACGPLASLPHPLASLVHFLHHFA